VVNLLILNAKGENPEALLKKLEEFPDASAEFKFFSLETANKQFAPGELIMIADRTAKEIIAISLSRTETGIDPFALKKSLGFLNSQKKKLKKEQMPKDSIGILVFKQHKIFTYPNLKQYALPKENARWVAFLSDLPKEKKKDEWKKEKDKKEQAAIEEILMMRRNGSSGNM
jgi:hypothetical protein